MHRKFSALAAISAIVLGAVACLFFGLATAHAQSIQSGNDLAVPASKTINGSYFAGGRSIDIGGTVNGDVICGTQSLTVSGTVHGDIICGAQSITITGHVDGNVRLAGQSITLAGTIGRNASVIGQSLNLGSGSTIGGDLSYAGSSLTSDGKVGRDIVGAMQTATINGSVGRNMSATVNKLSFGSGASVGGTVYYASTHKASVASGAKVEYLQQSQPAHHTESHHGAKGFAFAALWFILAALFCSLILVLIMPLFFWRTSEEAVLRPGWTILVGFITSIVLPALIFLAFATIIGIPLGLLLLLVWFVLMLLSFPVTAFYLGRLLFTTWMNRNHNAIVLMVLGVIVLVVLLLIPFVDIIAWFLMVWTGFGSLVRAFRHQLVRPDYQMPAIK